MLDQAHQKTDAGRAEIRARALVSHRVARNLLLVLDASKPAGEWLALVQGATEADLQQLLSLGLVESVAPAQPAAATGPASGPASESLDYSALYAYLTRQAKPYLGLMKGYRLVLEVERCADLAALQELAARFVDMVREAQGEIVAAQARRAMGLPP